MRARQYDPATGSFLSTDPLRISTTSASSPYAYASDLPLVYDDPSGLCLGGILGSGSCTQEISNGYHAVTGVVSDVSHAIVQPFVQTAEDDWSCISRGTHCVAAAIQTGLFFLPGGIEARDIEIAANELTRNALRDVGTSLGERITGGLYRLASEERGGIDLGAFKGGAEEVGSSVAKNTEVLLNTADASAADAATRSLSIADAAARPAAAVGTDSQVALVAAEEVGPAVGELRAAGQADAHHVIQDAAVRDVPGYETNAAPGVQLEGPSTEVGSPHYLATQVQRTAGVGGTYGAERQVAAMALRAAGYSDAEVAAALTRADAYFGRLGLAPDSPLRVPGNRSVP